MAPTRHASITAHQRADQKIGLAYFIDSGCAACNGGKVWDLKQVVAIMGTAQLGQELTAGKVERITAFLLSLTGTVPTITHPVLPPEIATTPRPSGEVR